MKIYSYVVEHDTGHAPNPYFGFCTLCRCKFSQQAEKTKSRRGRKNIVELAEVGDWVIGTGGASKGTGGASKKSAGNGKLVYAMRVDERLTRQEYFSSSRFAQKKPLKAGNYQQTRGDNLRPRNDFERHDQFVLISSYFYYFGDCALEIPERFKFAEKSGPGFRYIDPEKFSPFLKWLEENGKLGKQGEPCCQEPSRVTPKCKSSC